MKNVEKELKICLQAAVVHPNTVRQDLTFVGLVLLACLLVSLAAVPARAEGLVQDEEAYEVLKLKQLRVQVLSEYDDPRVLIIVQGRLDLTADVFPRRVSFRIPTGAQVNQMAYLNMGTGEVLAQPYDITPDPHSQDWSIVSYTLENAHFFYEYYINQIEGNVSKRFTFRLYPLHEIDKLHLEIQKPLAASDFDIEPKADYTRLDEVFGFTYYCYTLESVSQGEVIEIDIQYTKSCSAPSLARVDPDSLMDAGSFTAAHQNIQSSSEPETLPAWVVLLIGSVIAGGMFSFIWIKNTGSLADKLMSLIPKIHCCPNCSKKLIPGANYCHSCGRETGRR
jgi:hypothetical protein